MNRKSSCLGNNKKRSTIPRRGGSSEVLDRPGDKREAFRLANDRFLPQKKEETLSEGGGKRGKIEVSKARVSALCTGRLSLLPKKAYRPEKEKVEKKGLLHSSRGKGRKTYSARSRHAVPTKKSICVSWLRREEARACSKGEGRLNGQGG